MPALQKKEQHKPSESEPKVKKSVKKSTAKKPPRVLKKNLPTWWLRMSDKQRELYVKKRPKSRYSKFVNLSKKKKSLQTSNDNKKSIKVTAKEAIHDARVALKEHANDRHDVRAKLKEIAHDPKMVEEAVDKKLTSENLRDRVEPDKLNQHMKEVEKATRTHNIKKWAKLLRKTAIYAGLGVAGAVVIGTGALPYAIILANLIKESNWAFKSYKESLDNGVDSLDAMCSSAGHFIKRMSSNPMNLAAVVALKYGDDKRESNSEDTADTNKHSKYFDSQKTKKENTENETPPD